MYLNSFKFSNCAHNWRKSNIIIIFLIFRAPQQCLWSRVWTFNYVKKVALWHTFMCIWHGVPSPFLLLCGSKTWNVTF